MPIRVGHEISGGSLGQSAYTAGRGQRAERDLVRAERDDQIRRGQDIQLAGLAMRDDQIRRGLTIRERQQEVDNEFRQQGYEDSPGRNLQQAMAQQQILKDRITWEYSLQDKRELEKIAAGRATIRKGVISGLYTPEQGEELDRQMIQLELGVFPGKVMGGPNAWERMQADIATDLKTGRRYTKGNNGVWVDLDTDRNKNKGKFITDGLKITYFDSNDNEIPRYDIDELSQMYDSIYGPAGQQQLGDEGGDRQPYVPDKLQIAHPPGVGVNGQVDMSKSRGVVNKQVKKSVKAQQQAAKAPVPDVDIARLSKKDTTTLSNAVANPNKYLAIARKKFGYADAKMLELLLKNGTRQQKANALRILGVIEGPDVLLGPTVDFARE